MRRFVCIAITPAVFGDPGVALAASRAGGIGILDLDGTDLAVATEAARVLAVEAGEVGLRASGSGGAALKALLPLFAERPHWLIVAASDANCTPMGLGALAAPGRSLLVEITEAGQLERLVGAPIAGIVVRGHECGGWVGEDTTFILLQKVIGACRHPVYVAGAAGVHGAAACRAAGAAGVVLDDQLLMMPESPLPRDWRRRIAQVGGKDAKVVGEVLGAPCRVLLRPDFAGAQQLQRLADECQLGNDDQAWRSGGAAVVGWGPPETHAWPVGQAVGLAADYRHRYKTTGRLIEAIERRSGELVELARRLKPFAPDSALAQSHRTRYPVVQGPMTRVSDSAPFADSVSRAGALPFLALALMSGEQTLQLLRNTAALVGDRSWGVGLLGFAARDIRDAQIAAIWEVKPPFALIAGGRPDQAAEFERHGIATYIHAPAPELLQLFIDQGARRFVFEGRECGGHIGPLASLTLWEGQIELLLRKIPQNEAAQVHVLFAGGIHDALSTAMLSAMAAPLVERGMRVGVLVGSGYLFTEEIVATGAIVPEFQAQAMACHNTVNLETGPGHATRCADTPFGREFQAARVRLLRSGESAEAIRDELETYNLGRLRVASKGIRRDREKGLVAVPLDEQRQDGMYMIGQVATLRDGITTLAALHADICDGSVARLAAAPRMAAEAAALQPRPSDIAIVGIGTLLPKAQMPEQYWNNLLNKVDAITEVPRHRWDWRLYFDPDRNARDKIYAKWGGFIDQVPFDPLRYGIPPRSLATIDPLQLLTLECVRRALEDAGYADGDFDRTNTSVILGAGGGLGDFGMQYGARSELPRVVGEPDPAAWDRLPEWSEESFAGSLLNVTAGRVANRFNFGGLNFTTDAACASALAAVSLAVAELETGRCNVAIAGGVDTSQSPFAYLCFSKTQALSPNGKGRTFDKNGDGIVIGEGLSIVVLKRLADAERAGDRIYAVIKAVAGSSDGKALGLTAPLPEGQMRALSRAYAKAGISPSTLSLVEAHGTGTSVGDRAEAETIVRTLEAAGAAPRSTAIGSVKTLIGHTKAAAGGAGLVKVALALHHRVLPPHANVTDPLDAIGKPDSPIYLLNEPRPWFAPEGHPRRAGVSAFGFGGTNFHAVLEEYGREYRDGAATLGGDTWPCELFLFRGRDKADLQRQIERVKAALAAGAEPLPRELALALALRAEAAAPAAVGASAVCADLNELRQALDRLLAALAGEGGTLPPHLSLCLDPPASAKVAFLFPGQGSQYVNMGREQALYLGAVRRALEAADTTLAGQLPHRIVDYMFPPAAFTEAAQAEQRAQVTATEVAQPAIGALAAGFLDLVRELGIEAQMTAGHSYGEFAALHAAGALSRANFLALSAARGRVMSEACNAPERGAMAAVMATRERVEPVIAGMEKVAVANHNAPLQVVISGAEAAVKEAAAKLSAAGMDARLLPVAGAFHSYLMAPSKDALAASIRAAEIAAPAIDVFANATGKPYEAEPTAVREQLERHLLSPVEFLSQVENMHAAGARVFVEIGPKSVLTGLAGQILKDKPHLAVALDGGGGLRATLAALGALATHGVSLRVSRLFDERAVAAVELEETLRPRPADPATMWYVTGGWARPAAQAEGKSSKLPGLTVETLAAEKQKRAAALQVPPPPVAEPVAAVVPNGVAAAAAPAAAPEPLRNGSMPPAVPTTAPAVPPAAPLAVPMALAGPAALGAFEAYQQTMRQFLSLQETVLAQFLGGAAGHATAPPVLSAAAPPPMPVAIAAPSAAAVSALPAAAAPIEVASIPVAPVTDVPAAPEPPAAAPAGPSREALNQMLLALVSERTGYPPEMLGLDRDVEAELGIDSIKRVEILGGLQQQLPEALSARVKAEMETLTRVKTLSGIVDRLVEALPAQSAAPGAAVAAPGAPAPVVATPSATTVPSGLSREALSQMLLALVSERTGYPPEMLDLDRDVEAELGIDSIKRVEILGGLQQQLPEALGVRVKAEMETLTRVKTLSGIVDRLLEAASGANTEPNGVGVAAAPPAASAPPTAAPSGPSREALNQMLLALVSERTGYPPEMLGLDRDVEAELGIDSIKRVEILGGLQQQLPEALGERVKAEMEMLTRVKTLGGIVDRLVEVAPGEGAAPIPAAPATDVPAVAAAAPAVQTGLSREALSQMLLALVSERTGYPTEMLGLDRDVEAELGIDSIKRVEILGGLQQQLPEALGVRVKAEMETLTRVKTLGGIVDRLSESAPAEGSAPSAPAQADPPPAEPASVAVPPRLRMAGTAEPLPAGAARALSGTFIVTEDALGVAPAVAGLIGAQGGNCVVVERAALAAGAEAIASTVAPVLAMGPVAGIVHLAPLAVPASPESAGAWRREQMVSIKSLHALLQAFGGQAGFLVAASAMGGHYGRGGAIGLNAVVGGGVHGLAKTAKTEWPGLHVALIDIDPARSADEIARQIVDEMRLGPDAVEIGYPGGARTVYRSAAALAGMSPAAAVEPSGDWVVLATGGARGITAELLHEIARPGMRIVLAGRSALPGGEPAELRGLDGNELRAALIARARAQATALVPAAIDRQIERIRADREMRTQIARLSAVAAVDYRSVDVRDDAAFAALIDELYGVHGRIDAVLHGAGVIEDKLIRDKTVEGFDRVLGTKADSVFTLARHLRPDTLKLLVLFGSVAGRFGNPGQGDYAAANEVVTRMAWHLHHIWPGPRIIAINWGPWDSPGMATEALRAQMRKRGIEPIGIAAGREYFADELRQGAAGDVELIVGAGPWSAEAAARGPASYAPAGDTAHVNGAAPTNGHHAVFAAPQVASDRSMVVEHVFDLNVHRYLSDHQLDGVPVLPAAGAVEWIAQFVESAWPDWKVQAIGDLRVLRGIRLVDDRPVKVLFRARASSHADAESLKVSVELAAPDGKAIYYRGVATLVPELPPPYRADIDELGAGESLDPGSAYRDFLFHGPRFQLLTSIDRIDQEGVDAAVAPSDPAGWLGGLANGNGHAVPQWLFDPGLVDAAPQLAIVWSRLKRGTTPLPSHFGRVERYGSDRNGERLSLRLRVKPNGSDNLLLYDAEFVDQNDRVRLIMRDIESASSQSLNRLA